jgi:Flp pilus assembly protein TadG
MFMVSQTLRRWRDRGAAAVEFAIVVPVLIILIFGSIEFGLAIQARTQVGNAAREGVRVASLGGSVADVQASALNAVSNVNGTKTVTVTCTTPGGASCTIGGTSNGGNIATVVVNLNYSGITGMFTVLTNTTISASSYMRIEG